MMRTTPTRFATATAPKSTVNERPPPNEQIDDA
jgi:hypothetical protein